MFSGIVEGTGEVRSLQKERENIHFTIHWSNAGELKVDQSLSHNGVCLTVVAVDMQNLTYKVTAIRETLIKSNLGLLQPGDKVRFDPVSLREYEHWKAIVRDQQFELHPIHEAWEAAA